MPWANRALHKPMTMDWLDAMMVCSLKQHILPVLRLLLVIEYGVTSLELLELRVPAHVPLGTRAQLSCRWQLGPADVLYSVKWYKDGKEFFRHVPRDVEPRRKFPLPGVDVEHFDSSGSNLTLAPAVLLTGGRYRCEVSGEKPLFPTVSNHVDMAVIVLPDHGPALSGFRPRYRTGDRVQVTCTSGRSRPATQLAWYINGEPAAPTAVRQASRLRYDHGLEGTSLKLDFTLAEQHFKDRGVKIKCLATLATVYWRSNEESAVQERTAHDRLTVIRSYDELDSRADRVRSGGALLRSSVNALIALYCVFTLYIKFLINM